MALLPMWLLVLIDRKNPPCLGAGGCGITKAILVLADVAVVVVDDALVTRSGSVSSEDLKTKQ